MSDVSFRSCRVLAGLVTVGLAATVGSHGTAFGQLAVTVQEIGPKSSTLDASDPDGASGGRVNGLAVATGNANVLFAASEWGGIFRSGDGGKSWTHLPGHVPQATWDVEIDPSNPKHVYATSFYDGRIATKAGINVSIDSGTTWNRAASATPPQNFCLDAARRSEPSAFGIAISDSNARNVFVGTNCGVAFSSDSGTTWRYVDPTPADGASSVWDVIVHHGGIIDVCGDDGHLRSTDGGATWASAATGINRLPGGRCSIAASPDEPYVLFAVVGTTIYETLDGGATWANRYQNPSRQGRIPFVATNKRNTANFDLWFGDIGLHRASCATPSSPAPGGSQRCQATVSWAGSFTRNAGGHDDLGDIAFDLPATTDRCPILMSSDGGVYYNTVTTAPACHTPVWEQPDQTPQAVWNWDMAGARRPGTPAEDLYFGNQDTGSFATTNAAATPPNWANQDCCDVFDVAAESARVLYTVCCYGGGRSTRLFVRNSGMIGGGEINTYPPGNLLAFQALDSIASFGAGRYSIVTSQGVFVSDDVSVNPIQWRRLGAAGTPENPCGIQIAGIGASAVFYVKSGGCDGDRGGTLWRHVGTATGGTWQAVTRTGGGQFGVYSVDPGNADRIIASDLAAGAPAMVMTTDGGATWTPVAQLDTLMTGNGAYQYWNQRGPRGFTTFSGYPQPSLVAFDPNDPDIVAAGAVDAGVFVSIDGGTSWALVTDPNSPATSGVPHIPRPQYAYFEHDDPDRVLLYIGSRGRGQWRIGFSKAPPVQERHYLYTTLRVVSSGGPRGCSYGNWDCMTSLCRADIGASAWRGWAGCQKIGSSWLCLFECGQVRKYF